MAPRSTARRAFRAQRYQCRRLRRSWTSAGSGAWGIIHRRLNDRSNPERQPRHRRRYPMAVRQPTEIDLERVDALIAQEEVALKPKHAASIAYRSTAQRTVAGGVASSWQDS